MKNLILSIGFFVLFVSTNFNFAQATEYNVDQPLSLILSFFQYNLKSWSDFEIGNITGPLSNWYFDGITVATITKLSQSTGKSSSIDQRYPDPYSSKTSRLTFNIALSLENITAIVDHAYLPLMNQTQSPNYFNATVNIKYLEMNIITTFNRNTDNNTCSADQSVKFNLESGRATTKAFYFNDEDHTLYFNDFILPYWNPDFSTSMTDISCEDLLRRLIVL